MSPDRLGASARRFEGHVIELADREGLTIRFDSAARPQYRRGHVVTWPVRDNMTYYVALHELGHGVNGRGPDWRQTFVGVGDERAPAALGRRLLGEARAWEWAVAAAIVPPDECTKVRMLDAWTRHIVWCGGRVPDGGIELVAVEHHAEYMAAWATCRSGWAWIPR